MATRRKFLVSSLAAGVMTAGCVGSSGSSGKPKLSESPVGKGIDDEPSLGADITKADAGIVMFSDPSCPYCEKFHEKTFPKLKKKLIDPGKIGYVYRTYPKVKPWGTDAVLALESVYKRDESVFWDLRDYYYSNPGLSVLTEQTTRKFLKKTDVNGDGVIADMKSKKYQKNVEEDSDVARDQDMTTIPSYAIIRDGRVHTKTHGVSSYSNMKTLLGV